MDTRSTASKRLNLKQSVPKTKSPEKPREPEPLNESQLDLSMEASEIRKSLSESLNQTSKRYTLEELEHLKDQVEKVEAKRGFLYPIEKKRLASINKLIEIEEIRMN